MRTESVYCELPPMTSAILLLFVNLSASRHTQSFAQPSFSRVSSLVDRVTEIVRRNAVVAGVLWLRAVVVDKFERRRFEAVDKELSKVDLSRQMTLL